MVHDECQWFMVPPVDGVGQMIPMRPGLVGELAASGLATNWGTRTGRWTTTPPNNSVEEARSK